MANLQPPDPYRAFRERDCPVCEERERRAMASNPSEEKGKVRKRLETISKSLDYLITNETVQQENLDHEVRALLDGVENLRMKLYDVPPPNATVVFICESVDETVGR